MLYKNSWYCTGVYIIIFYLFEVVYNTAHFHIFYVLMVFIRCMKENRGSKKTWLFVALSVFCFSTPAILIIGLSFLDNFVLVNYNSRKNNCSCSEVSIILFPCFQLLMTQRGYISSMFWWCSSGAWRKIEDQTDVTICRFAHFLFFNSYYIDYCT